MQMEKIISSFSEKKRLVYQKILCVTMLRSVYEFP